MCLSPLVNTDGEQQGAEDDPVIVAASPMSDNTDSPITGKKGIRGVFPIAIYSEKSTNGKQPSANGNDWDETEHSEEIQQHTDDAIETRGSTTSEVGLYVTNRSLVKVSITEFSNHNQVSQQHFNDSGTGTDQLLDNNADLGQQLGTATGLGQQLDTAADLGQHLDTAPSLRHQLDNSSNLGQYVDNNTDVELHELNNSNHALQEGETLVLLPMPHSNELQEMERAGDDVFEFNEPDTDTGLNKKTNDKTKVSNKICWKSCKDFYTVPVGQLLKLFLTTHNLLKDISLYRGKREVKRQLVSVQRHEGAVDRGSWQRGKQTLERNRYDDQFVPTEEGQKKIEKIKNKCGRDQYVVAWYLWCPGHGNCKRACNGYGKCTEGCKGMAHKQDRHNCSVHVALKIFLGDLSNWKIKITGNHIPDDATFPWQPPPKHSLKLDENTRDVIMSYTNEQSKVADICESLKAHPVVSKSPFPVSKQKVSFLVSRFKKKTGTAKSQKQVKTTANDDQRNLPQQPQTVTLNPSCVAISHTQNMHQNRSAMVKRKTGTVDIIAVPNKKVKSVVTLCSSRNKKIKSTQNKVCKQPITALQALESIEKSKDFELMSSSDSEEDTHVSQYNRYQQL
ncbi:uncharacterized protein LOC144350647 [Saccoglossus kowalevskii]